MDESLVYQKAVLNVLYSEYHFFKHHHRLEALSDAIEYIPEKEIIPEQAGTFLLDSRDPILNKLTPYERYITLLLNSNTKREVSSLLNCSPSYLSKLLDKIKTKLLKN